MADKPKSSGLWYERSGRVGIDEILKFEIPIECKDTYIGLVNEMIPRDAYVMALTQLAREHMGMKQTDNKPENLATIVDKESKNPYHVILTDDPVKAAKAESHVEAYKNERQLMDDFITKLAESIAKQKNGNYGDAVFKIAKFSKDLGEKLYHDIRTSLGNSNEEIDAKISNIQKIDRARELLYASLADSTKTFRTYFINLNKGTKIDDSAFNEFVTSADLTTLLFGYSKICTHLLDDMEDANLVDPKVAEHLNHLFETKYDDIAEFVPLDHIEKIKADLLATIKHDMGFVGSPEKIIIDGREANLSPAERVSYSLNQIDDGMLHILRILYGIDARKEHVEIQKPSGEQTAN